MSSFFKDSKWDEMDWLNKAIEPYTYSVNLLLAKLPIETEIPYEDLLRQVSRSGNFYTDAMLAKIILPFVRDEDEAYKSSKIIDSFGEKIFTLVVEPDSSLDLDNERVIGGVRLVMTSPTITDEMIESMYPNFVHDILPTNAQRHQLVWINELLDIVDCKDSRNSTSSHKKIYSLKYHMLELYSSNKWKIRNVDLAIKLLRWMSTYIRTGDKRSLANISKLKCMIYSGDPIYSMEEIV